MGLFRRAPMLELEHRMIARQTHIRTRLRDWNDSEQHLENGEETTLTLDEADEYFLPRSAPEQLGTVPEPTGLWSARCAA